MAAHRYWKLKVWLGNSATFIAQELEFRLTPGGADQTSPSTVVSGSAGHFSGAEGPDKAIDDNNSTFWQPASSTGTGSLVTSEIIVDFGAGNDKDINEISWRDHASFHDRTPSVMSVESSDDGSAFTVEWWALWGGTWTTQTRLTARPTHTGAARYWAIANIISENATTDVVSAGEIDFYEAGVNVTSGGVGLGSVPFSGAFPIASAFDNNSATEWASRAITGRYPYIGYDFGLGVAVSIDEIRWQARTDGFAGQNIVSGDVLSSTDGISFTLPVWSISGPGGWVAGTTQTFLLPESVTSVTPAGGPTAGGTSVIIDGFGFTGATGVLFDASSATSVVVSDDNTITCDTPAHIAGVVDVTVQRPTTDIVGVGAYTYDDGSAPTIVSLTPNKGTVLGGTAVTLTGTDLTGTTALEVAGVDTSFTFVNSTTITFTTLAYGTSELVDVKIYHPLGDYTLVDGFEYINMARVTQAPLLVVHLPIQATRLTQVPILMVHLPIQQTKITQAPILPIWTPTPIPLPMPVIPEVPVKEVWQWNTTLNIFEGSREQRSALRAHPRMSMQFDALIIEGDDYRDAYEMMLKYISRTFNYPMYVYSTKLTAAAIAGATTLSFNPAATDLRDGEVAALFDPLLETTRYVTISTVDVSGATLTEALAFDVPEYYLICPAPKFRFELPRLGMVSMSGSMSLELIAAQVRDVLRPDQVNSPTLIDGLLLLDVRPLANDSVPLMFDQNMVWLDNAVADPEPKTSWYAPRLGTERKYLVHRPFGFDYWRAVASYMKGQQNPFLLPTFRNDLPVIETPALSATEFKTDSIQHFEIWRSKAWRYLMIQSDAGTVYRKINEVLVNYDPDGQPVSLTVKLSESIGATVGSNTNMIVSFANTCRLDSDEIVVDHYETDSILTLKVRTTEE